MRNMDSFSRMAGLDIDQAMSRGGSQGSSTFQGAGLDAGSGMLTGMYTQGIANLAVQSGAFDERTLALYGGKSGVGQLMTEAQGAFGAGALQQALLPYLMRKGSDGKLTLDKDALARLQSGETSYQDAVRQGGSKFRGDREGMLQLTNNSRELSSLVMRSAGPEAIQQMLMTQGASLADQLGVDLTSGYKAMGLTGDQARVLAQIGETPEFFNKLRQQQQAERQRLGHDAERARVGRSDLTNTAWDRFGDAFGASPWDRMQKGMSNYTARTEEDNRLAAVGAIKLRTQNPLYDSTYKYAGAVQAGRRRYSLGDLGDGTATTGEYLGGKARELSNFYTDEFRERGSGAGGDLVDTAFDDAGIAREAVLDIGTLIQEARGKESYVWMNASRRDRRLSAARDAAGMYVGARQLSDANPAAARSDLINAAQLGGVRGGVPGAHRFLSKAAVLLAQKARKLEDDRSLRQSDMLEALQSAGLSAKDANAVLASPDGAAKLLNLARGVMDSKTRKQMDEHTAKYTAGLSGLAKEGYERRMGASDETSLMKRLTGLGFEADEFSDLSDDQRATLKEFSDMSEDEIAGVFLAAMLNKEDVVGRSEAQDAAEHIMALNPEIADKVAAGMRKLEANPEMRKVIQKDLKKIAKSEDSEYSSVGLETLRSRGQAMKDTQSQLGIASLLKGYRAKATSANVDLADTTSPEEAMSNIAALSSAKKARLDPAVVSAASSGNREAFLRAISSSAGMTSDGVVIGSDGSADEAVEAQDKKISDTAVMAKRFAQYANANAKALEANTRELKRFNDKRDGVAVPVEGPNY